MKKLIVTLFTVMSITGTAIAQKTNPGANKTLASDSANVPEFKWERTSYDFGKIPQGKPASITYVFTNVGKKPLVITGVHPSCGCTTNDFSKDFIQPGQKGFVKLTYNALNVGAFTKSTTVTANTIPDTILLLFNGEVIADANAK